MQKEVGNRWAVTAKLLTKTGEEEIQRKLKAGELEAGQDYPCRR